jgi:adenylate kinase
LMKQLIIHRPDSPLDFLIERIGKKEPIRIFIVGPPGSISKHLARRVSKDMKFESISVGEIVRKEATKNTEIGKQIAECLKNYKFIPDSIIGYIIKTKIMVCENEYKNWVLEGFPRTKAQALSLRKIGIIPDKFIMLNVEKDHSIDKIKKQMIEDGVKLVGEELDRAAENALFEYTIHTDGIRTCYDKFIYEATLDKPMEEMELDLLKMIGIKMNDPLCPPRIIILGPPGSGRSTQARTLSQRYGIVHVSVADLLKEETNKDTTRGKIITKFLAKGELVPSVIVISLVERRLKESDCIVNGWIMDGFPKTIEQVSLLTQMKIAPTKVVILECKEDVCIDRLKMKRIDPNTGIFYNLIDNPPEEREVEERLIEIGGNDEETVKKRWVVWDEFVGKIEEIFSN